MSKKPNAANVASAQEPETFAQGGEFERVAQRVMSAFKELNAALEESGAMDEMRVEMSASEGIPRHFNYRIYRLTHATLRYTVSISDGADGEAVTLGW